MTEPRDLLPQYVEHLQARLRSRRGKPAPHDLQQAVLPEGVASFCTRQPSECLNLIVRALAEAAAPELVEAIGNELLENLLNESSGVVGSEVSNLLRTNKRFRQAFAFGNYASVDPALLDDWVRIFQSLGTTKAAERKSLRSRTP